MTSLEATLMYNVEMQFNRRVTVHVEEISECPASGRFRLRTVSEGSSNCSAAPDRHFDYVVIATEPMSVRQIVAPPSSGSGSLLSESMLQTFDSFVVHPALQCCFYRTEPL